MKTALILLLTVFFAMPTAAQEPIAAQDSLRAASVQIEAAITELNAAQNAQNQTRAIANAIQALESGLAAMRFALRGTRVQQVALQNDLTEKSAQVSELLVLLEHLGAASPEAMSLHPDGPISAARAALILARVMPEINANAAQVRAQVEALNALEQLHQDALENVETALAVLQRNRAVLHDAIKGRAEMPEIPANDLAQLDRLLQASDDLSMLADQIELTPLDNATLAPVEFESLRGALPLPVVGTIRRSFGEPDAAGLEHPGIIIAAPPLSLVTAPQSGIVRFAGDFLSYGLVIIIEPAPEYLEIFAGFGQIYVNRGDELASGDPIGLLGGQVPDTAEFLIEMSSALGGNNLETLYIEVREQGAPVDPSGWFAGLTEQGN